MSDPTKYGERYYCVKTPLSDDGEIYLYADEVIAMESGQLVFRRVRGAAGSELNLCLAAGYWTAVYAASAVDGRPVAVELWRGEVER